jgi:hypothetical protein
MKEDQPDVEVAKKRNTHIAWELTRMHKKILGANMCVSINKGSAANQCASSHAVLCCSLRWCRQGNEIIYQVRSRYTGRIGGITAILNGEVDVLGVLHWARSARAVVVSGGWSIIKAQFARMSFIYCGLRPVHIEASESLGE